MKHTTARLFFVVPFFVNTLLIAQKKEPPFNASLHLGVNNTSYFVNEERLDKAIKPFFGVMFEFEPTEKFHLLFSASVFDKASRYKTGTNFVRTGFEIGLYPSLRYDDFSFHLGFQLNAISSERFETKSYFTTPKALTLLDSSGVSLLPVIGIDIKLSNSISLGINQSLFLRSFKQEVNTQFLLRYRFGKENNPRSPTYRAIKRMRSKEQIQELKEGVLLVRLKTSQPKIDALKRFGYERKALKEKQYQLKQNKSIMRAFKDKYSFSKVYFFYSYHSNKVKDKEFKRVFLNENLEIDPTIVIDSCKTIYTAELANIEQDTVKFLDTYQTTIVGDFNEKLTPRYYGGSDISFQAIIIKDNQFNQLTRPFPYYSRYVGESVKRHPEQVFLVGPIFIPIFNSYTFEKSIERLNRKLFKYYNKHH